MIRKCANLLDRRPWEKRKRDLSLPRHCRRGYDLLVVKGKSIFLLAMASVFQRCILHLASLRHTIHAQVILIYSML